MPLLLPVVLISLLGLGPIGNLLEWEFFAFATINQSVIYELGHQCHWFTV